MNKKRVVAEVNIPIDIMWEPGEYDESIMIDADEARAVIAGILRYSFNIPWDVLSTDESAWFRRLRWSFEIKEIEDVE